MMKQNYFILLGFLLAFTLTGKTFAFYLNDTNISVSLGTSMDPEPFNSGLSTIEALARIIDADSASEGEIYFPTVTNIWVKESDLELVFDFGTPYHLEQFHFWNSYPNAFDVDQVTLQFFDENNSLIDAPLVLSTAPGPQFGPVFSEDFDISVADVRYVNALLTSDNQNARQLDFLNIGFTAVPLPAGAWLFLSGLTTLLAFRIKPKSNPS